MNTVTNAHSRSVNYIAIDFDDTIMNYRTEKPLQGAKVSLDKYHKRGDVITIFTNRMDQKYTWIRDWLITWKIPYDRIICGKPFYTVFIDDKAKQFTGWDKDYI